MKGILIDPYLRRIEDIEVLDWEEFYQILECSLAHPVPFKIEGGSLLMTEQEFSDQVRGGVEALWSAADNFFKKSGVPIFQFMNVRFAGRGVLLGIRQGEKTLESCDTKLDLLRVADNMDWTDLVTCSKY